MPNLACSKIMNRIFLARNRHDGLDCRKRYLVLFNLDYFDNMPGAIFTGVLHHLQEFYLDYAYPFRTLGKHPQAPPPTTPAPTLGIFHPTNTISHLGSKNPTSSREKYLLHLHFSLPYTSNLQPAPQPHF